MSLHNFDRQSLLESLSKIYISIFLFDLKADDLVPIQSNKHIDALAADPIGAQAKVSHVMSQISTEEHVDNITSFVDLSTLDERMNGENNISVIFKGKINGWCRARFIAVDYAIDGSLYHVLYTVECINEEKERENYLLYMSQTDFLTEISNRGFGERSVIQLLADKKPGVFGLLDVDLFKSINDIYGHDIGDQVLINIGRCLKEIKKSEDIVMRLGGDEFAFYLVDETDPEKIKKRIHALFEKVSQISKNISVLNEDVSISVGTAFYKDGISFEELYKTADNGVYASKRKKGSSLTFDIE